MKAIFGREPVVWIGIFASLVFTILETLTGPGIIVSGNNGQTIANIVAALGPVIAAFIARNFVTPTPPAA